MKKGDKFVFTEIYDNDSYLTVGKIYKVVRAEGDVCMSFMRDILTECGCNFIDDNGKYVFMHIGPEGTAHGEWELVS